MQLLWPHSLGRHAWYSTQPATRVAAAVACAWRATRQQASCSNCMACRSQAACFCSNAVYLLPALRPHGGFLLSLVALTLAMRVRLGSWGAPCWQQLYAIQNRLCRVVPCASHEEGCCYPCMMCAQCAYTDRPAYAATHIVGNPTISATSAVCTASGEAGKLCAPRCLK